MPRPKLKVKVHRFDINMTLREETDDDLIALFRHIPSRQRVTVVKMALRASGIMQHYLPTDEVATDELDTDEFNNAFDDFVF